MKNIIKLIVVGLSAVAIVSPTFAADDDKAAKKGKKKRPNPEAAYKKIDANADGKVTLDEFKTALGKRKKPVNEKAATRQFKRKDKDGDGNLTLAEYSAKGKRGKKNPKKPKGEKKEGKKKGEGKKKKGKDTSS